MGALLGDGIGDGMGDGMDAMLVFWAEKGQRGARSLRSGAGWLMARGLVWRS